MIKRVEVNYRGIFQKNLGKKIGSDIVMIASRMGQRAFSNGRYSDSPERNGIPCKYFAFVSPDLSEEELEAECGAKLEIDDANISVVLDDTMCKGVEPWGWHGVRPINERVVKDGCLLVVSHKKPEELLKFIGKKPYNYRLAILDGDASLAGLWVNKDDLTHERILGGIAAIDPAVISIEAVEAYLMDKTKQKHRAEAARAAYESLRQEAKPPRVGTVTPDDGIVWTHEKPVLPKWIEMVDELQFEDDSSPWEHWKKDSKEYIQWVEGKKGKDRVSYPVVTGKGITVTKGEVMPEGKIIPVRKTEEVEA